MAFRTVLRSDIVESGRSVGCGPRLGSSAGYLGWVPRLGGGETKFWLAYLSGIGFAKGESLESHQLAWKSKRGRLRWGESLVSWCRCVRLSELYPDVCSRMPSGRAGRNISRGQSTDL